MIVRRLLLLVAGLAAVLAAATASASAIVPPGPRVAFVEWLPEPIGLTNVVMEVNADGTCPRQVLGHLRREGPYGPSLAGPGLYAPTWQPGPGREACAISC